MGAGLYRLRARLGLAPALTTDQHGVIAVQLALYFPEWVRRRAEGLTFVDDTTVRQRTSVTFRWPSPEFFPEDARPRPGDVVFVPLAVPAKRTLRQFDVAAEDGSTFPILATKENGDLSAAGLIATVWGHSVETRGVGLTNDSVGVLEAIVTARPVSVPPLLDIVRDPAKDLGSALVQPNEFRALTIELAGSFLLLAPAIYEPGRDRVLKYAYSEPLPWTSSVRNFLAHFGLVDLELPLTGLPLGLGSSYHVEVETPEDVRLSRATLYGSYVNAAADDRVTIGLAEDGDSPVVNLHAARPSQGDLEAAEDFAALPRWKRLLQRRPPPAPMPADPLDAVAERHPTPVQRSDRGFAILRFRPQVAGVFIAATIVSVVTALLLLGARTRLAELDGQVGSAVLLALPVLVAGYLVRSEEHEFATRLLRGVRMAALLVGMCALLVAALLGAGLVDKPAPPRYEGSTRVPHEMQVTVDIATGIAVVLAAILVLGVLRTWLWPVGGGTHGGDSDDVV